MLPPPLAKRSAGRLLNRPLRRLQPYGLCVLPLPLPMAKRSAVRLLPPRTHKPRISLFAL